MTRGEYTHQLFAELTRRGHPVPKTLHTRRASATQMQCEGGEARYNPFNVTLKTRNSWDYNWNGGFPVQSYSTAQEGIEATAQILEQENFKRVLGAFQRNESARKIIRIIGESPWGTSQTLMTEVLKWISRVPSVLRWLEKKPVSG